LEIAQLTIPKNHLLSILGDPERGGRDAQLASRLPTDPRAGEVTLIYPAASPQRPFLIVVPTAEHREILARIGTYADDLAPLTQWVRVVTVDWARRLLEDSITPKIDWLTPAWVGAIVGEILVHQVADVSSLSMNWVYATTTFAVARSRMLWNDIRSSDRIAEDISKARALLRSEQANPSNGLQKIWSQLSDLGEQSQPSIPRSLGDELIRRALLDIRSSGVLSQETIQLMSDEIPDIKDLTIIDTIGPEDRVRFFDRLAGMLRENIGDMLLKGSDILQFCLGYIVGRVGAGEVNLNLTRDLRDKYPLVVVWAAILPALHNAFPWGRAFEGFGRLVLRELIAPLYPKDMPNADISLDELSATMNAKVDYRRLPFRTTQRTFAMVELIPGVSSAISFAGIGRSTRPVNEPTPALQQSLDLPKVMDRAGSDFQKFLVELRSVIDRHLPQPPTPQYERNERRNAKPPPPRRGGSKRSTY
jgi:hypothetical protein